MPKLAYGYKIFEGHIVEDEEKAVKIRTLFSAYLEGLSLNQSAKKAGINKTHSAIGTILSNKIYMSNDYYPAIVDKDTFEKAGFIREEKVKKLGRNNARKKPEKVEVKMEFKMDKIRRKYKDPFENARYLYSLIESEV